MTDEVKAKVLAAYARIAQLGAAPRPGFAARALIAQSAMNRRQRRRAASPSAPRMIAGCV